MSDVRFVSLKEKFMKYIKNKTEYKKRDIKERQCYVLNAEELNLGRLATLASLLLRDKLNPSYTPSADNGNHVIIINAKLVKISGQKNKQKMYYKHSGYPGGLRQQTFNELSKKHPEQIIEKAIKGMLPKNALGRTYFKRLKVYKDNNYKFDGTNIQLLKM